MATGLGWQPEPGKFHLLRVEPDDVMFIRRDDASSDHYVTRWPAGTEIVLRGNSATSQAPSATRACSSTQSNQPGFAGALPGAAHVTA